MEFAAPVAMATAVEVMAVTEVVVAMTVVEFAKAFRPTMTLYLGITSAIQDNESNDTNECKRKTFMMAMFPPNNKQRQGGESDFRQQSEVTMGPFSRYQVINHGRSNALL